MNSDRELNKLLGQEKKVEKEEEREYDKLKKWKLKQLNVREVTRSVMRIEIETEKKVFGLWKQKK